MGRKAKPNTLGNQLVPSTAMEIIDHRRSELVLQLVQENINEKIEEDILFLTPNDGEGPLGLKQSDPRVDQLAKHLYLVLFDDIVNLNWTVTSSHPFSKKYISNELRPLLKKVSLLNLYNSY